MLHYCTILITEVIVLHHLIPTFKWKYGINISSNFPGLSQTIFPTVSEEINLCNLYWGYQHRRWWMWVGNIKAHSVDLHHDFNGLGLQQANFPAVSSIFVSRQIEIQNQEEEKDIPHICHFVNTTAIWGVEILHLKVRKLWL